MTELVHEIWLDADGHHGCCLAGPAGEDFRRLLDARARLIHALSASSHFNAMQIYNAYLGREPYTTDQSWDFDPYPESWKAAQDSKER